MPVTFRVGSRTWRLEPRRLGIQVDWAAAVDAVRRQGEGFGPLRGFLNNFVQILPMLKPVDNGGGRNRLGQMALGDMPALPMFAPPPAYGLPAPSSPAAFSGSLQVENPNKNTLPFGFIRV